MTKGITKTHEIIQITAKNRTKNGKSISDTTVIELVKERIAS